MSNKVQQLFDKLVEGYNLRAIKIGDETWYAMNDLPLSRQTLSNTKRKLEKSVVNLKCTTNFVEQNTKLITVSDVTLNVQRNFEKVNNTGEMFGNFAMINYVVMTSRLGDEYKIEMIDILNEIRMNDFYVDDNISDKNLEKLKEQLAFKTEVLKKCYGDKLINIINVSKRVEIPIDFILEHMVKNGWVTKKNYEVTKKGAYGKVIKKDGVLYLSEEGIKLVQSAYSNSLNKPIRENALDEKGEKVFEG